MGGYYTDLDNDLGADEEADLLMNGEFESKVDKMLSLYNKARNAKVGTKIECPSCTTLITKKSYQHCFCSNKGRNNCKDTYYNSVDDTRRERAKFFS